MRQHVFEVFWRSHGFTPKKWRWTFVLTSFDIELVPKSGQDNVVIDALSRREEHDPKGDLPRRNRSGEENLSWIRARQRSGHHSRKGWKWLLPLGFDWVSTKFRFICPKGHLSWHCSKGNMTTPWQVIEVWNEPLALWRRSINGQTWNKTPTTLVKLVWHANNIEPRSWSGWDCWDCC